MTSNFTAAAARALVGALGAFLLATTLVAAAAGPAAAAPASLSARAS